MFRWFTDSVVNMSIKRHNERILESLDSSVRSLVLGAGEVTEDLSNVASTLIGGTYV